MLNIKQMTNATCLSISFIIVISVHVHFQFLGLGGRLHLGGQEEVEETGGADHRVDHDSERHGQHVEGDGQLVEEGQRGKGHFRGQQLFGEYRVGSKGLQ